MMKEYYVEMNNMTYFIGNTDEIKALYKSFTRGNIDLFPLFKNFPRFDPYKSFYGLCIDWDNGYFMAVSFENAMMDLFDKGLV